MKFNRLPATFSVRVSPKMKTEIEKLAQAKQQPMAELLREMLTECLRSRGVEK